MEGATAENLFDIGEFDSLKKVNCVKFCVFLQVGGHRISFKTTLVICIAPYCFTISPGLAALELPEQPTVNSAADFFVNYIILVGSVTPVQEVVTLKGRSLIQCILQAIAWAAPRSYLSAFTDIIAALRTHCVTLMSQWLEVS